MHRITAAILGVPTIVNGLTMLLAGGFWYDSVSSPRGSLASKTAARQH